MPIKTKLTSNRFISLKNMGNRLCQTVSLCSCLNTKDCDMDEKPEASKQFQQEELKNDTSFESNIFTVSNESFSFELLNQNKQQQTADTDRPLYVDTEFSPSSRIEDILSLDSRFNSRILTPNRSFSVNFAAPSLVLSVFNTDDTMNNFYEFLISENIFVNNNFAIDSLPLIIKDKICEWSKRSIWRIRKTAEKYFFFKSLTKRAQELKEQNECENNWQIGDLVKRPFSIFGIVANGLKFLNRLSLRHSSYDEFSDTIGLLHPRYSYSPLRQLFMRIYDINFF